MMRRAWIIAGLAGLSIAGTLGLAGGAGFGQLAMRAGMPGLAVPLLADPAWRGAALYHAGDHAEAAKAFEAADQPFNAGNANARAGALAEALVAYDRAIARNPEDAAARFNFDLVGALYGGTRIDALPLAMTLREREENIVDANAGNGTVRAAGTGNESTNTGAGFEMPELLNSGLRRVPRMFDEKYIAASDRWLETMEDQPGRYLRARLAAERKRRIAEGIAPPDAEDPE